MSSKSCCILFVLLAFGFSGSLATAGYQYWTDGDPCDQLWIRAGNWNESRVPDSSDSLDITSFAANGPVITGVSAFAGQLGIGSYSPDATVTMTMTGGNLTVGEWVIVGGRESHVNTGKGILDISGGFIDMGGGWFAVGNGGVEGLVNMTGGTINTSWFGIGRDSDSASVGHVNLDGGEIVTLQFVMFSQSSLDIEGGSLRIGDDVTADIAAMVAAGQITAYGGTGTVSYDTTTVPGWTVVTATPPTCHPDYPIGDITMDCVVNLADFCELAANWLVDLVPPSYDAPQAVTPPAMDGVLSAGEWAGALEIEMVYPDIVTAPKRGTLYLGSEPTDAADCSANWYVTWDNEYLYLACRMYDDVLEWLCSSPGPYNNQDVVQLCFNPNDNPDAICFQDAGIYDLVPQTQDDAGADIYRHDPPFDKTDVIIGGSVLSDGYVVEVALPWSEIVGSYVPQPGDTHGFGLMLLDIDGANTRLISDFGQGVNAVDDPTLWNTLTLVE